MAKNTNEKSIPKFWLALGACACMGIVGLFVFLSYWLQPPVVPIANIKYIQLLRTAVSSQNIDYVKKVDGAVDSLKEKGELGEPEWSYFKKIIAKALAGDWQAADKACLQWEKAQSDRTRAPDDKLESDSHGHSHTKKLPPGRANSPAK